MPLKFLKAAKAFLHVEQFPIPEPEPMELVQGEALLAPDASEMLKQLPKLPSSGDVLVMTESGEASWSDSLQSNVDQLMQNQLPFPTASNQMLVSKNGAWETVLVEDFILGMFPQLNIMKQVEIEAKKEQENLVEQGLELLKKAGMYVKGIDAHHYAQELSTATIEFSLNDEAAHQLNVAYSKMKGFV